MKALVITRLIRSRKVGDHWFVKPLEYLTPSYVVLVSGYVIQADDRNVRHHQLGKTRN